MGPPCPLGTARTDPAQEKMFVERTYKVRNFWTMSVTKSPKAAEDSQTKKKFNDPLWFIALQTQLAVFLGSRNKQVILDSYYSETFFST